MTRNFIIGTRGSDLALWQAHFVQSSLGKRFLEHTFEIKIIKTTGDERLDVALSKIGDKGLFTRQIETELLAGNIDLAVHSLKDLQTEQPDGLVIGAVCDREVPNDVLISRSVRSIGELPIGARVATGSLRRRSQLLNFRPDLKIEEIRGNVPTRLMKFDESDLDGMILAYAGVHRLGLGEGVSHLIPFDVMLPAVGQGVVAIEIRDGDETVRAVVATLDHKSTRQCVTAERAFLRQLEGGCQVPIGAHATITENDLRLEGMVGGLDGAVVFRERLSGDAENAEAIGVELAEILIGKGAAILLEESRNETGTVAGAVI
ncbi:hydroxymethylbilane synthase [soil metagenome]